MGFSAAGEEKIGRIIFPKVGIHSLPNQKGEVMDKSLEILNFLENSTEEEKVYQVKNRFQLSSERNARAILHILENSGSADKYEAKIAKLVKKLEEKYAKELKRLQKRSESFFSAGYADRSKLEEISGDIHELQRLRQ
jgi:hypothetical protein